MDILTSTGSSCIALVPAMQIHLLNSTSAKPLIASLGQHNFDICMQVADEVRKTYFGAALVRRLFLQAQAQIKRRKTRQEPTEVVRQMEGPTLGTRSPRTPRSTAPDNQSFTDTDTIKNLGSAFTGFESTQGGYEYVATILCPFRFLEADWAVALRCWAPTSTLISPQTWVVMHLRRRTIDGIGSSRLKAHSRWTRCNYNRAFCVRCSYPPFDRALDNRSYCRRICVIVLESTLSNYRTAFAL